MERRRALTLTLSTIERSKNKKKEEEEEVEEKKILFYSNLSCSTRFCSLL
jgi:hypothetical protein